MFEPDDRCDGPGGHMIDEDAGGLIVPASEPADPAVQDLPNPSVIRPTLDFVALLLIGILASRTFVAEAYIVPTGSMAPTLLGMHRSYTCGQCAFRFALGVDESGASGQPVCPNCGAGAELSGGIEGSGDRLLVQKFLYDLRPPHRWEAVVFQNPADPGQAYVKRVVGLPGESLLIRDGDLYIDGRIMRKTPEEQRAMRLLVFDGRFVADDVSRFPRWRFRLRGEGRKAGGESGWKAEDSLFRHEPVGQSDEAVDWLEYRHWQPDRGGYGPVLDFQPYNSGDLPGDHRVDDLTLEADVRVGPEADRFFVRLDARGDRFVVMVPLRPGIEPTVRRNGKPVEVRTLDLSRGPRRGAQGSDTGMIRVEASLVDRRLSIRIDDEPLFEPLDYDDTSFGGRSFDTPLALGVPPSTSAEVAGLKVWRDVYYTDSLVSSPTPPFGVGEPYQLGADEFFVLGDNSPVSNDSRLWPKSPVVRRELLLGKPFLVHLPSQAVPLKVFGGETYWIPDPREIRYIR